MTRRSSSCRREFPKEFEALVADRRGDIYNLQGKKAEAKAEYIKAYKGFDERSEYRRLVEVKLSALGVDPQAAGDGHAAPAASGSQAMIHLRFRHCAPRCLRDRTRARPGRLLDAVRLPFFGGGSDKPKPAELPPNAALIAVRPAWTARVGEVNLPLTVNVSGTTVAVASSDGTVAAIDARDRPRPLARQRRRRRWPPASAATASWPRW